MSELVSRTISLDYNQQSSVLSGVVELLQRRHLSRDVILEYVEEKISFYEEDNKYE